MPRDFSIASADSNEAVELNAYNAALYELGFRWHWDTDTYRQLFARQAGADESIHHYLSTRQPHLLRAYDAAFLVQIIREKKAQHAARIAATGTCRQHFDWAQALGGEIGA